MGFNLNISLFEILQIVHSYMYQSIVDNIMDNREFSKVSQDQETNTYKTILRKFQ